MQADPELCERIGEERIFEVDVVPPRLFKREIVRPKFKHRPDRQRAPLLALSPARIAPGGFASAGLIAWALTAKYAEHPPFYRQETTLTIKRTPSHWQWLRPMFPLVQKTNKNRPGPVWLSSGLPRGLRLQLNN